MLPGTTGLAADLSFVPTVYSTRTRILSLNLNFAITVIRDLPPRSVKKKICCEIPWGEKWMVYRWMCQNLLKKAIAQKGLFCQWWWVGAFKSPGAILLAARFKHFCKSLIIQHWEVLSPPILQTWQLVLMQ